MFHVPNKHRLRTGVLASGDECGNNGAFKIKAFTVIASDGKGWEHVSVSLPHRCPKWEEMCFIKNIFWDDDDAVVQFHPPKFDYVNNHNYCLHLWRCLSDFPRPDSILVGVKN